MPTDPITDEQIAELEAAFEDVPELISDWDGTNHYELNAPGAGVGGETFWWLDAHDALAGDYPSETPQGQRLGRVLDGFALCSRTLPALLRRLRDAEAERAQGDDKVLRCAFCGKAYPQGTPVSHHERLTNHVKSCPKHPMRKLSAEFDSYMRQLAISIGCDMEEFDRLSAHGNERLRWAVLIQMRINDLLATAAAKKGS